MELRKQIVSRNHAYGVSSKFAFGRWEHDVYRFESEQDAQTWLKTEEYDGRERELMSKTRAIKLAGKARVERAFLYDASKVCPWYLG